MAYLMIRLGKIKQFTVAGNLEYKETDRTKFSKTVFKVSSFVGNPVH